MQRHAEHFRARTETAGDVRDVHLRLHVVAVGTTPAIGETSLHSHGGEHLGIAATGFRQSVAAHAVGGGGLRGPTRRAIRGQGEDGQDRRAHERGDADEGVEEEADEDVDRHPRQIEEGRGARAAEEGTQLVEIAQGQQPVARGGTLQGSPYDDVEHPRAEGFVQRRADACKDTRADRLQNALKSIEDEARITRPTSVGTLRLGMTRS